MAITVSYINIFIFDQIRHTLISIELLMEYKSYWGEGCNKSWIPKILQPILTHSFLLFAKRSFFIGYWRTVKNIAISFILLVSIVIFMYMYDTCNECIYNFKPNIRNISGYNIRIWFKGGSRTVVWCKWSPCQGYINQTKF